MIKSITGGAYINVSYAPQSYVANNGQGSGDVRWNTVTQRLEAYDGQNWIGISTDINISADSMLMDVVDWARRRRGEEEALRKAASDNPMVQDCIGEYIKATEKLQVAISLTKQS